EIEALFSGDLQQWTRNRQQRRRLVVTSVESARYPVELGNPNRRAYPRVSRILADRPAEMRQADTPVQRQPAGGSELILQEARFHVSPQRLAMAQRRSAAVTGNDSEELVIALAKHLEAGTGIVPPADDADLRDAAHVVRATVVFRNHRCISRVAVELPNV